VGAAWHARQVSRSLGGGRERETQKFPKAAETVGA
jgi:hypothetical protein